MERFLTAESIDSVFDQPLVMGSIIFNGVHFSSTTAGINYNHSYPGGLFYHSLATAVYLGDIVQAINAVSPFKHLGITPSRGGIHRVVPRPMQNPRVLD